MLLPPKETAEARVPITGRVPQSVVTKLEERAARSGHSRSAAMAELLEFALHLDEKLKPFAPAIERLMKDEQLSLADAVVKLMWMDVELNPKASDSKP
jgi:plasmid stability protein